MIKYRLNTQRIIEEMERRFLTVADLARLLGWSRQLAHHAINNGGKSFAPKLAAVLGIDPSEIITVTKGGTSPRQDYQPLSGKEEVVATAKRVKPAPKTAKPKKAAPKTKKK